MQRVSPEGVVAIVRREDRVLFIQRAPWTFHRGGYWAPPGGAIEHGETQEDAVIRETLEEAGVLIRPIRKVWECESPGGRWVLHWWLAEYVSGELATDPYETSDAAWLTVEEFVVLEKIFDTNLEFFQKVFPDL